MLDPLDLIASSRTCRGPSLISRFIVLQTIAVDGEVRDDKELVDLIDLKLEDMVIFGFDELPRC